MNSRKPQPDWAGLWFKLVEEVAGEFTRIRFGMRERGSEQITWTFLPHVKYDGVGGFAHLLRSQAQHSAQVRVPRLREEHPPSLIKRMIAFLRFLAHKPKAPAHWISLDRGWRPPLVPSGADRALATEFWDVARTQRMSEKARSLGVSLNTFLFWALGRVSASELVEGEAHWMMPVNMRGPVAMPNDTSNHAAYVQLELSGEVAVTEVHAQIKRALKRHDHWASWSVVNLGRIVGYRGMRRLYLRNRARGHAWVGVFSNLGNWDGLGASAPDWYFCPPVATSCPMGAGAVICNGKLTLTLEAHPSITRDPARVRSLMDRWMRELEA